MMNITIKITGPVPYTMMTLEMTAQISADQATQESIWYVVERLQAQLGRAIDEEMARQGIKLGPDGLRVRAPESDAELEKRLSDKINHPGRGTTE